MSPDIRLSSLLMSIDDTVYCRQRRGTESTGEIETRNVAER